MKLSSKVQSLTELIKPAVRACDVLLWGIEFRPQGKRSLLRIYIDVPITEDGEDNDTPTKSVSVEQCKKVSHQVSGLLDVHDPIAGEYVLEVSSPGWDRTFFSIEQMNAYIGQTVAIRLINSVNNRRKFTGKLIQVADDAIKIEFDETYSTEQLAGNKKAKQQTKKEAEIIELSCTNIDKANLVFEA